MKLGECLAFYLRYYAEMTKIYREEEEVPSLPEPQDTKDKASKVGKAADEEAALLLEKCADHIVKHYSEIGSPKIATHRCLEKKSQIEREWTISVAVWPKNKYKSERMKVGVSFAGMESNTPELVPWIWCKGMDDTLHPFASHLQRAGKAKATCVDIDIPEGAIALARIPIELPTDGFEVDASHLLDSVKEAIQRIDQGELVTYFPK